MATAIEAVVVQTNGEARKVTLDGTLESYQKVVGGYIEGVFGDDFVMYVNEEGHLLGMEFNRAATEFATHFLGGRGVYLVGPALIVGSGDAEGNDTNVHQSTLDYYEIKD